MNTSLLRNKKFLYLWASQLLSNITVNIIIFLVLVHLFESTGSSIASSFIWVANAIPAILIGPIAAAAVDMYDRRKVLIISNLVQAGVTIIYALLFQKFLYLSYGVVLGYSLMDQLYVPAETASLPAVVRKEKLAQANGLFFISQQAAAILGFGLAGLVVEVVGFRGTMFIGTCLLLLATVSVARLPRMRSERGPSGKTFEETIYKFFTRISEGYSFIRHRRNILLPFLFLMWLQVSLAILVVNIPAVGTQLVKTKASLAGIFTVGPAGFGALVGTIIVTKFLAKKVSKKRIIDTSLLVTFLMFTIVAGVTPFLPFWLSRGVLILGFFIVGIAYVGALIPTLTYLQVNTPKKLLGRVFGNFWFLTSIATMFPVLFSATITEVLGVSLLIILMGLVSGVVLVLSKVYLYKIFSSVSEAPTNEITI